jgi:hypothetical protein
MPCKSGTCTSSICKKDFVVEVQVGRARSPFPNQARVIILSTTETKNYFELTAVLIKPKFKIIDDI